MRLREAWMGRVVALLFGLRLICAPIVVGAAKFHAVPQSEPQVQQLIHSVTGRELFRAYCSSCHGPDAKGHGPAAGALKAKVPDLTVLTRNNRGQFPSARVRTVIVGDDALASHGSREMPIWGPIFHQVESDVDKGNVRLENLVKYLESIQSATQDKEFNKARVTTSSRPSGAELYKQRCAVCHGNDLQGNGPAPAPFRELPPDLTTLARRNGGDFPNAYVAEVLRTGVKISAHGPAEMPIWGTTFSEAEQLDDAQLTLRITGLVDYIKSRQAK